jgi:hypothetical protein
MIIQQKEFMRQMSLDIEVIVLQMTNIDESIIIYYFSFIALCLVNDVSPILAFNVKLYNNLEVVYFCRCQNFVPFSKKI